MSQSIIEEMANKIIDEPPSRADQLLNLIGHYITKCKKSTVLKATEICDQLFEELMADNLLIASDKPKQKIVQKVENT